MLHIFKENISRWPTPYNTGIEGLRERIRKKCLKILFLFIIRFTAYSRTRKLFMLHKCVIVRYTFYRYTLPIISVLRGIIVGVAMRTQTREHEKCSFF